MRIIFSIFHLHISTPLLTAFSTPFRVPLPFVLNFPALFLSFSSSAKWNHVRNAQNWLVNYFISTRMWNFSIELMVFIITYKLSQELERLQSPNTILPYRHGKNRKHWNLFIKSCFKLVRYEKNYCKNPYEMRKHL